jgi:SsrA-binding protein
MASPKPAGAKAKEPREPSVDNRRARFEYEFLERFEAGVALTGTEIKSIRTGQISLNEAYARVRNGEVWLLGMHIPPYKAGSFSNHEPNRPRKLLLHREQIVRLSAKTAEKGFTIVPTRLYFKRGRVKIDLALARGKKLWDKRRETKEREAVREMAREVRRR